MVLIRPSKCILGATTLQFLGHQVDSEGIRPLEGKVTAILKFPTLTTRTKLREFLGLVNFYHCFVKNRAATVQPLNELLSNSSCS